MAEKQGVDSNNVNEEWTKAEMPVTPVELPMSTVDPATPVAGTHDTPPHVPFRPICIAPSTSRDAAHKSDRMPTRVMLLQFAAYFVHIVCLSNVADLLYMNYQKQPTRDMVFPLLKVAIGFSGVALLEINKPRYIFAHAFSWLCVYVCWNIFFLRQAFNHWHAFAATECAAAYGDARASCVEYKWLLIVNKGIFLGVYTFFGFAVSLGYAVQANALQKATNARGQEKSDTDAV